MAAENRERLGYWEIDTVCGKVEGKTSYFVTASLIETLKDLPLETVTPDRGKEFSKHSDITKELGVEFYFPLPHHPW